MLDFPDDCCSKSSFIIGIIKSSVCQSYLQSIFHPRNQFPSVVLLPLVVHQQTLEIVVDTVDAVDAVVSL